MARARAVQPHGGCVGADAAPNQAEAAIHYSGALTQDFGTSTADYFLTMEGAQPEFEFGGADFASDWFYVSSTGNAARIFRSGTFRGWPLVGQLVTGDLIGPASHTPDSPWGEFFSSWNGSTGGAWDVDGETGYMGFSFLTEGAGAHTVYGWAQVQRINATNGRLLGWAYEDSGAPIAAGDISAVPEPSGLALLALGAAGMATLRRRRQAAVNV